MASTAFQSRSIVWLPMSPICPAPKSQNMFHDRQFIPRPAGKIARIVWMVRRRAKPEVKVEARGQLPRRGQVSGAGICRLPQA